MYTEDALVMVELLEVGFSPYLSSVVKPSPVLETPRPSGWCLRSCAKLLGFAVYLFSLPP
jgi:hypothetical protein